MYHLIGYLAGNDTLLIGKPNRTADDFYVFAPMRPGVIDDDLFLSTIHYGSEFSIITKNIFNDLAPNCLKDKSLKNAGEMACCNGVEKLHMVLA